MLINNWKMTYEGHRGLECTAPCTMYSVLLDHKLIDDPFYELNETRLSALSDKGCVFESQITADEEMLAKEHIELVFLGLDTLCRIYLNGKLLGSTKNMHRRYIFDVKPLLTLGANCLRLEFGSPTQYFAKMNARHFVRTNGDTIPGAAHLRKALYMSGWDWGPTLPDMGIFRPVSLEAYDGDVIENIFILQDHAEGAVTLDVQVETRHGLPCETSFTADGKTIALDGDKRGSLVINEPKLWWARGYGEQHLYEVSARIVKDGVLLDEKVQRLGLRTVTVSTAPDPDGEGSEFAFVLNGEKIFIMGANYIPQDNLLSRVNPQRTEELIKAAADGSFNCLRIWGGGCYPEDEFYDLCDEYGILVWQDSMVACCNVWLSEEMTEEFTQEMIYNLRRLRHHASLAMWCGNNEMEEAVVYWEGYSNALVREDYLRLYERIFPALVDKYAPQTFYWQASPSSGGGFDEPRCFSRGDCHYWDVWHGSKSFTEYRKHRFRFCSEYGFESYPALKTIQSFCPPEEMNCFSRVMEGHQKCRDGNMKILMYLADLYRYPVSFETLVYASQLLQADAIKYGVEHFRRCRGYTMGSIYWQFNDCWPVASWSSVDSFGRYKALHYAAAKFYAPVAMGLFLEDGRLAVNVSNETLSGFEGSLVLSLRDRDFNVLEEKRIPVAVDRLTSLDVYSAPAACGDKYTQFICARLYDGEGRLVMQQTELFAPPKHFEWKKPNISLRFEEAEGGILLHVKADTFAKGVYIDFEGCDPKLSDNFFDLCDGDEYTVTVKTDLDPAALAAAARVMSVYDIGR